MGEPIFTEAHTLAQLHERVRMRYHFDERQLPTLIHLQFVRQEVIAV